MRGGYRIPTVGNLPVPYIARYADEAPTLVKGLQATFQEIVDRKGPKDEPLFYLDEATGQCFRDDVGWLWTPAPDLRSGKVEFSQVHPLRHRECMVEYRCQVCAKPAGPLVRYRLPISDIQKDYTIRTSQAPVCERCERAANTKCPHLANNQKDWMTITTERRFVERCGVLGDVWLPDMQGGAAIIHIGYVPNEHHWATQTWARQQVVTIHSCDIVRRPS